MSARKGPGFLTIWMRAVGIAPGITPTQRLVAVLAVARFHSADKPEFYLSLKTAELLAGVSKSTVQRALEALTEAGWLVRTRPHTYTEAAYFALAIPLAAMDIRDPVTRKTPAQALRTSGQADYSPSGQADYSPVVSLTRKSGQADHIGREVPLNTPEAVGSAPAKAGRTSGARYGECVRCGRPAPLGAALCSECAQADETPTNEAAPRLIPGTATEPEPEPSAATVKRIDPKQRELARRHRYRKPPPPPMTADEWVAKANAKAETLTAQGVGR